ncbi:Cof-type HAD-IIB family hydrolase [Neobacillus dielmonensis]|uniref:Cof-type HAD-IIB family hydrolase n=1 Tax=Neobacillus dielmonensis TaxID=1347369 RepID=UPI0005AA6CD0|nr:Cof-type HAD-IIB family hydrolase [Neobacillus dielmonensis]
MKLIALDLDGTTLNSKKEISPENLQVIKKAQQQGHIVMALSGRSPKSINMAIAKYGLDCPIGANNGTALYADGKLIELISFSRFQAQKIALEIEKEFMPYNFTTNKGSFGLKDWKERFDKVQSSGRVPQQYTESKHYKMFTTPPWEYGHTLFENYEDILNNQKIKVQKFQVLALDPEQKERLRTRLEAIEGTYVTSSSPFNLELTHINGNKGNGLKAMARHFNIPLVDTVAIGDEKNDIPMFQSAGLSIAMGNAEEEVKQNSDFVTLTNDENGVAYAFEKYILKD